jgi:hypothetical protein
MEALRLFLQSRLENRVRSTPVVAEIVIDPQVRAIYPKKLYATEHLAS